MKRFVLLLLLSLGLGFSVAHAGVMVMPPPGPARIAKADAVVVGRVEALEPEDVKVGTAIYRIAVVKINQGLKGIKDEKTLRVGFVPLPTPDDKGPRIIRTGARPVQLAVGQDGLFLLTKQPKENFYTIGGVAGYYVNSDKNDNFEKEVAAAKAAVKAAADSKTSLKSKDAEERLAAAAILIVDYRTFRGPKANSEPIDADESKLILQALADADWQGQVNYTSLRANPVQLFQRLGVGPNDGFTPAKGANYQTEVQNWLRDNAAKYRIQRFVASDAK